MSEKREMIDVPEIDPVEMTAVEGGFLVGDGYCGTLVPGLPIPAPGLPIPAPPLPVVIVPLANVLPQGLATGATIDPGL